MKKGNTQMSEASLEGAIEGLKKFLSEKGFGDDVAAAEKIKMLTSTDFVEIFDELISDSGELKEDLQVIKDGFEKFKLEIGDSGNQKERCKKLEVIGNYPNYLYSGNWKPKFMIFACSDSRLFPSDIIFKPGNAFVVRNIANMVPAYNQLRDSGVAAAIKYAIKTLEVRNILIIGHSDIPAEVSPPNPPADSSNGDDTVEAKGDSPDEKCKHCKKEEVSLSLTNLRTYPDVIEKKELQLLGGYFDLTGKKFVVRKQIKPVEKEVKIIEVPVST